MAESSLFNFIEESGAVVVFGIAVVCDAARRIVSVVGRVGVRLFHLYGGVGIDGCRLGFGSRLGRCLRAVQARRW